jgi:hypothetical protein
MTSAETPAVLDANPTNDSTTTAITATRTTPAATEMANPSQMANVKDAGDDSGNERLAIEVTPKELNDGTNPFPSADKNEGPSCANVSGTSDQSTPFKPLAQNQEAGVSDANATAAVKNLSVTHDHGGQSTGAVRPPETAAKMGTPTHYEAHAHPYQSPNAHSSQRGGPYHPASGNPNMSGNGSQFLPPGPDHQQWQYYNPRDPPYYHGHSHGHGPHPHHMQGSTHHPPPPPSYHGYDSAPPMNSPPRGYCSPHRHGRGHMGPPHGTPMHGYNPNYGPPSGGAYYEHYNHHGYHESVGPPISQGVENSPRPGGMFSAGEMGFPRDARMPPKEKALAGQKRSHDEAATATAAKSMKDAGFGPGGTQVQNEGPSDTSPEALVKREQMDKGDLGQEKSGSTAVETSEMKNFVVKDHHSGNNAVENNESIATPERDSKNKCTEENSGAANAANVSPSSKANDTNVAQPKKLTYQNGSNANSMPPPANISPQKESDAPTSHVHGTPSSMPPPPNANSTPMHSHGASHPANPSPQGYSGPHSAPRGPTQSMTSPGGYDPYYGSPSEDPYYGHYQYGPPSNSHHPHPYQPHGAPHAYPPHGPPPPHQAYYYDGTNDMNAPRHHPHGPDYERDMYYNNHLSGPPPHHHPQTPYAPPHSTDTSQRQYVTPESHPHGTPNASSPNGMELVHSERSAQQSKSEEGDYTKLLRSKGERMTDRKKLQNKAWFDRFSELQVYKDTFGDCLVPQKYHPSAR